MCRVGGGALSVRCNLTSAEGHWEVSTPWFLEWMGLMGARNWLADIIDGAVSNERAAKEFDKLTDLITGAQRDGSGWCRHVSLTESKAGLRRVGTYCGRAVRGGRGRLRRPWCERF